MDNFVVSARKYRPATFASVVGQKHITSTLKNAISRNQLAHAYLFCGPRGVGKTTCARIFAKAINCLSPVDSEACNECESCRGFNEGRSFNIHELDAASNNSVDDIRSLTEQVRIPPQIGRYSVYIIDEVHMLSSAAFNAFLKTLEEPPAHAVFILATTEKHKIIPTILSRCQIFDFNRIRVEDSVEYLKYIAGQENVAFDDESLHLIALKADGGMRDALSMFDKAVSFCGSSLEFREVARTLNVLDYDTYFKTTDIILAGDYPGVLTLFDEVLKKGFSPQIFISGLNGHFRDLLMCKNPQTLPLLEVGGTLLERYRAQAGACDPGLLFEAISLLTTLDGTLRTATNQRLNTELGLMKLCAAGQKKTPDLTGTGTSGVCGQGELPDFVKRNTRNTPPANAAVPPAQTQDANRGEPADSQPRHIGNDGINVPEPVAPGEETGRTGENKTGGSAPEVESAIADTARDEPTADLSAREPEAPSGGPGEETAAEPYNDSGKETEEVSPESGQEPGRDAGPETPAGKKPKRQSRAAIHGMPQTISGTSIQDIMSSSKSIYEEAASGAAGVAETIVDPRAGEKIEACRQEFIGRIREDRPRIAVALEEMRVDGNIIRVNVPTETLYEEIMRNNTELLTLLADMASVEGVIELKVEVREDTTVRKPIRAEDKYQYLAGQNPALQLLKQKLNLEIE